MNIKYNIYFNNLNIYNYFKVRNKYVTANLDDDEWKLGFIVFEMKYRKLDSP